MTVVRVLALLGCCCTILAIAVAMSLTLPGCDVAIFCSICVSWANCLGAVVEIVCSAVIVLLWESLGMDCMMVAMALFVTIRSPVVGAVFAIVEMVFVRASGSVFAFPCAWMRVLPVNCSLPNVCRNPGSEDNSDSVNFDPPEVMFSLFPKTGFPPSLKRDVFPFSPDSLAFPGMTGLSPVDFELVIGFLSPLAVSFVSVVGCFASLGCASFFCTGELSLAVVGPVCFVVMISSAWASLFAVMRTSVFSVLAVFFIPKNAVEI